MRVHDLRHSYATIQLHELGTDPQTVQMNLGHTNISTTFGVYGHVRPARQQESAQRMGAALRAARQGA